MVTSSFVALATGAHTIQVDWVSGLANAAIPGSLGLRIDGVLIQTLNGNTSTLRVETALLGLTAGVTSSASGTAYFDSFVSTRYTLP